MAEAGGADPPKAPYTAVIFGWWGSKPKHLRHYEELHRELGATSTVALSCSTAEMLVPSRAERAVKVVKSTLEGSTGPVVVHVFSNGGMVLYRHFFDSHPSAQPRLAAAVFDSTPGDLTVATFVGAWNAGLRPAKRRLAWLLSLLVAGLLARAAWRKPPGIGAVVAALLLWAGTRRHNAAYFKKCAADPIQGSSLYLYSLSDRLVSSQTVERMIAERRRRAGKARVLARRWEDSAHVAHYPWHRGEYQREVRQLLEDALPEHSQRQASQAQ